MIPQDGADDDGRCIATPVAKTDEGGEKRGDCIKGREAWRIRIGKKVGQRREEKDADDED